MTSSRSARRWLVGALACLCAFVPAPPASAHSGGDSTNYLLELGERVGDWTGAELRSVGLGDRLEVERTSAAEVVVLGYEGEPFLRLDPEGIWRNVASPATYLNEDRYARVELPPAADAEAPPRWELFEQGTTVRWHDHRTHWMSPQDPPGVQADRGARQTVVSDVVVLSIDGRQVSVATTVVWVPPPSPWPWAAGAIALAIAGLAAVRHRRDLLPVIGLLAAAAATVTRPSGVGWLVVALLGVVLAAVGAWRSDPRLGAAGAIAGLIVAASRLDVLHHALLAGSVAGGWQRAGVSIALGAGAATVIGLAATGALPRSSIRPASPTGGG